MACMHACGWPRASMLSRQRWTFKVVSFQGTTRRSDSLFNRFDLTSTHQVDHNMHFSQQINLMDGSLCKSKRGVLVFVVQYLARLGYFRRSGLVGSHATMIVDWWQHALDRKARSIHLELGSTVVATWVYSRIGVTLSFHPFNTPQVFLNSI
jgi:hypothetical protein